MGIFYWVYVAFYNPNNLHFNYGIMTEPTSKLKFPISDQEKRKRVIADRWAMLTIAILLGLAVWFFSN